MVKIFILTLISIYFLSCGTIHIEKPVVEQKILKKSIKPPKIKEDLNKTFQLSIASPNATRIRILNIKPKYKDGIRLKPGRYHIELSAKHYIMHKEWINLQKDTNLTISLKHKKNISRGFIIWKTLQDLKYINGNFWQDAIINKKDKMNWDRANNYCKNLKISINKNIFIDDFTLPNEKELINLRKYTSRLDYVGDIYWSSVTDKKHPQFAKYIYLKQEKKGWYSKNGKTYVRCISRKKYPLQLSLQKLATYLMKQEKYSYLDAYTFALSLKYGNPVIKYVVKIKNNKVKLTLRSQKYDSEKNYFYYQTHIIKEKKGIAINPKVKFEIINNKLVFRSIN